MDPITIAIVSAAASGALAGTGDAAKSAVVDAYNALKGLLKRKFGANSNVADAVEKIEKTPNSDGRKTVLHEELASTGADKDAEILEAAKALLERLSQVQPTNATFRVEAERIQGMIQQSFGTTNLTFYDSAPDSAPKGS